jgi:sulfonate transport system ATP-binding protein
VAVLQHDAAGRATAPLDAPVGRPADRAEVAPAVRTRDLRREFDGRPVLGGIDLDVAPGEFVALLGASGSGKSTYLRVLAGLDPQATGEVTVPDRLSVAFQEPRLLPWRRVWRNVALGVAGSRADVRRRAEEALREVGLESHTSAWPITLSGGEAQRVALARSLVRDPQLLLLDEPFGALDALTRIKMHALLARLCHVHQPAVVLVTHDVDEAVLLADRALVLRPRYDEDGRELGARISVDIPIDVPVDGAGPRRRSHPRFIQLRQYLLNELGVDESPEVGRHAVDPSSASADLHPGGA